MIKFLTREVQPGDWLLALFFLAFFAVIVSHGC
jgi:hypothetical protein